MKVYSIYFLLFLISKSFSSSLECQKVICDGSIGNSDTCILPSLADKTTTKMQSCPEGKICNIISEDPINEAHCDGKPSTFKKYPGFECVNSNECTSLNCTDHICIGKSINEDCTNANECDYGLTCNSTVKKCIYPQSENEYCQVDTDCDLKLGCHRGICIPYFSLDDGEIVERSFSIENRLSLCKSGYSNEFGLCQTLTQVSEQMECNDIKSCTYTDALTKKSVTILENCLCGYNPYGDKYCKLGSGTASFTKYITNLKDYYFNSGNCHIGERGVDGCLKDIIFGNEIIKRKIDILQTLKIKALYYNRIINSNDCAIENELPNFNYTYSYSTCPVYKCEKNNSLCASSQYNENNNTLTIFLYNGCRKNEICLINSTIYKNEDQNFKCVNSNLFSRYPGEDCDTHNNCKSEKCEKGKCLTPTEGSECTSNADCLVGYFCSSNICKEQRGEREACISSYDCKNDLLCYEGTCQDMLFSFDSGKSVEGLTDPEKYCKYGMVVNNTCAEIVEKSTLEGFRECDFGSFCSYKIAKSDEIFYKECECGYNDKGQGYCRRYHDYKNNEWSLYLKLLKASYDNNCHTENRYNCYNIDKTIINKIKKYQTTLIDAHLYYGCVSCAENVLSAGMIHFNIIKFIVLFALFILI